MRPIERSEIPNVNLGEDEIPCVLTVDDIRLLHYGIYARMAQSGDRRVPGSDEMPLSAKQEVEQLTKLRGELGLVERSGE
ncbi:MAG: hypothetical protein AAB896_01355 [Patescibacteria group bacterium]